jgi:hypothetical protein
MTGEETLAALSESVRRCAEGANQDKLPASILLEYSEAARNFAEAAHLLASALAVPAPKAPVRKAASASRH